MTHKLRRVIVAATGATLLAGTGALAVNQGYLGGGHEAEPYDVTARAVCGWRDAGTPSDSSATLASVTGDLVLQVGGSVPYRVQLTHTEQHPVEVPAGSAPVLVATTGVEATVVGYAPATAAPESRTVAAGAALEHADFGAFVACPDGPAAEDGTHLAPGSYELYAAQALGWKADGPFNTWARLGAVSVTPQLARGGFQPAADAHLPVGTCGTSLDRLPQAAGQSTSFDELDPVLAVVGEPLEPGVTLTNHGAHALTDAVLGGPALLVAQDGLVVARASSAGALPAPGLGAGQTASFGSFKALEDCRTGDALAPGVYEYAVALQARNPEAVTPFGTTVRGGALAVTATAGATRVEVARPEIPVCGASAADVQLAAGSDSGAVVYSGRATRHVQTGTLLRDVPDGETTVELELAYTGPERALSDGGHQAVLVRDGVVVASTAQTIQNAAPTTWATGSAHLVALQGWTDCDGAPFVAEGQYTALGFVEHTYVDEWGLPARHVTTLAPTPVSFAP